MADLAPVHLEILTTLQTALTNAGGALLFDGKVPDGKEIPLLPGPSAVVAPHACLWMGDDHPHPDGEALNGVIDALGVLPFTVLCVAGDNYSLTILRDVVKRALIGFAPSDCGEIRNNGALAEQPVASVLMPQRYFRPLGFWLSVGATGASAA